MELIFQSVWLVPFFPFLASILLGFGLFFFPNSMKNFRRISSFLSVLLLSIAMFISFHFFLQQITGSPIHRYLWSWVIYNNIILEIGYLIDPLTSIMLVLVTTVGVLVMIYSDSYMFYDRGYIKFFCYLSLFTASMLGLVLSPNLIQVYIFWELVGMCSYLLIGFWFTRPSAANACQKAFVTNRIGDFGLLLGILGFYWITGTFDFQELSERFFKLLSNNQINLVFATLCALFLFLGPIAKSAQFPLHIWLPDAMEGPTPISALIHAATMVAAGIFLVARMFPIFEVLPFVMNIISWTGAVTAFLGASLALAQKDLKKGLAYSTMSQLGYMMLALGIGSYKAGLFHLITHAYSKALLFLGSGSVIHSMEPIVGYNPNKSQSMFFMGGLRKHMPMTAITFLFGTLSLCGIPPFACFWSKDEILVNSWLYFPSLGFIAFLTAGLTAFYMFRIYFLTFEGDFRGNYYDNNNKLSSISIWGNLQYKKKDYSLENKNILYPKESDNIMLFSLFLLTIPTVFIGSIGVFFHQENIQSDFLSYWLNLSINSLNYKNPEIFFEFLFNSIPSISIVFFGILIAFIFYGPKFFKLKTKVINSNIKIFFKSFSDFIYNWSYYRGYIDEFYNLFFIKGLRFFIKTLKFIDQWIIDGCINAIGLSSFLGAEGLKYIQGGRISSYLFFLVFFMFLFFFSSYII